MTRSQTSERRGESAILSMIEHRAKVDPSKPALAKKTAGVVSAELPQPKPMEPVHPPDRITDSVAMNLVLIPAGTYLIDSPSEDKAAKDNEKPQYPVRLTRPFYLGATEVNVGQCRRFVADAGYQTEAEIDGKAAWAMTRKQNNNLCRAPDTAGRALDSRKRISTRWRTSPGAIRWPSHNG